MESRYRAEGPTSPRPESVHSCGSRGDLSVVVQLRQSHLAILFGLPCQAWNDETVQFG